MAFRGSLTPNIFQSLNVNLYFPIDVSSKRVPVAPSDNSECRAGLALRGPPGISFLDKFNSR